MADVKISALPLATTPLAGTEVLPIVQSATTDQVSVANLTAGRAVSAASLTLTTTPLAVGSGGTGFSSITSGYVPYATAANTLGSSSGLQFDGNNLGLGVTPSAWDSGIKAIELPGAVSLFYAGGPQMYLTTNAYYDSVGWKYKTSNFASYYYQVSGQHQWYTAPSGTAGNAITFTQAMTLDASGNLGLGATTTSGGRLVITQSNSVQPAIYFPTDETTIQGPSADTQIRIGGNIVFQGANVAGVYAKGASGYIQFNTGTSLTERMRIDASGNVGIATTSPSSYAKLAVRGYVAGGGWNYSASFSDAVYSTLSIGHASGACLLNTDTAMVFAAGSVERARIDASGNVVINTAAIATNATDGFLYVPTCAGTPTGTPTTYTGRAPIVVDTTNNKLYFYSGGAWHDAGP